jgi:hypothetical protein
MRRKPLRRRNSVLQRSHSQISPHKWRKSTSMKSTIRSLLTSHILAINPGQRSRNSSMNSPKAPSFSMLDAEMVNIWESIRTYIWWELIDQSDYLKLLSKNQKTINSLQPIVSISPCDLNLVMPLSPSQWFTTSQTMLWDTGRLMN